MDQSSHMLTIATRDLFNELDKSVKPVAPMQFWMVCFLVLAFYLSLHTFYLSFATRVLVGFTKIKSVAPWTKIPFSHAFYYCIAKVHSSFNTSQEFMNLLGHSSVFFASYLDMHQIHQI